MDIIQAIKKNDINFLKTIDKKYKNENSENLLHLAVLYNRPKVIDYILSTVNSKINYNTMNKDYLYPIDIALSKNRYFTVKKLVVNKIYDAVFVYRVIFNEIGCHIYVEPELTSEKRGYMITEYPHIHDRKKYINLILDYDKIYTYIILTTGEYLNNELMIKLLKKYHDSGDFDEPKLKKLIKIISNYSNWTIFNVFFEIFPIEKYPYLKDIYFNEIHIKKEDHIICKYPDGKTILKRSNYIVDMADTILKKITSVSKFFTLFTIALYVFDTFIKIKLVPEEDLLTIIKLSIIIADKYCEYEVFSVYDLFIDDYKKKYVDDYEEKYREDKKKINLKEAEILSAICYEIKYPFFADLITLSDKHFDFLADYVIFYITNDISVEYKKNMSNKSLFDSVKNILKHNLKKD